MLLATLLVTLAQLFVGKSANLTAATRYVELVKMILLKVKARIRMRKTEDFNYSDISD